MKYEAKNKKHPMVFRHFLWRGVDTPSSRARAGRSELVTLYLIPPPHSADQREVHGGGGRGSRPPATASRRGCDPDTRCLYVQHVIGDGGELTISVVCSPVWAAIPSPQGFRPSRGGVGVRQADGDVSLTG